MELMHHENVPRERVTAVFRYKLWWTLLLAPWILGGGGWFVWSVWQGGDRVFASMLACGFLLCAWLFKFHMQAGLRRTNWLMMAGDDGVYLQIRSYYNYRYPPGKPTVVFLPFDEIVSVGQTKVHQKSRGSDNQTVHRFLRYLDIRLRDGVDTEPLAQRIADERAMKPSGIWRARHVPVMVLRSGWVRADWVSNRMLDVFPEHVERGEMIKLSFDDSKITDQKDLDDEVLRLVEAGDTMTATALLRRHGEMSLTEAKRFVDDLTETLAAGG